MLSDFGSPTDRPRRTGRSRSQPPPSHPNPIVPQPLPPKPSSPPRPPLAPSSTRTRGRSSEIRTPGSAGSGLLAEFGLSYQPTPGSARKRSHSATASPYRSSTTSFDDAPHRKRIPEYESRMLFQKTEIYGNENDIASDVEFNHNHCDRLKSTARFTNTHRFQDDVAGVLTGSSSPKPRNHFLRKPKPHSHDKPPINSKKVFKVQKQKTATLFAQTGGPQMDVFADRGIRKTHRFDYDSDPLLQKRPRDTGAATPSYSSSAIPMPLPIRPPTPVRDSSPLNSKIRTNYAHSGGVESESIIDTHGHGLRTSYRYSGGSESDPIAHNKPPLGPDEPKRGRSMAATPRGRVTRERSTERTISGSLRRSRSAPSQPSPYTRSNASDTIRSGSPRLHLEVPPSPPPARRTGRRSYSRDRGMSPRWI
eukprot:TRINITY_DN67744_c2_g1_i1.p1 TRINITY_DN67744_c2_g1~~TRINITY_DN67744_c2_g1_i1.p1  ORF type:complete len:421 (+),score=-23.78 TRINITY_DN67744_c2_g1_i1:42-1304(+)